VAARGYSKSLTPPYFAMHFAISCTAPFLLRCGEITPYFPCDSGGNAGERKKPMLSPVIRFFQSWKRYGLTVQELSQLSDRELADIGITRSDIPRIAWEQSHQA
jgi:uncharacterized protein YjiS (DUF1127 family)